MEIRSFDTILTGICDFFDALISPKKIARSNTNIIYLIFKAIAKGFELINNVCVTLSNKFDPERCSVEDLNSIAKLVGTNKMLGSASGLNIIATNNNKEEALTLSNGFYRYDLNADTFFIFEIIDSVEIPPEGTASFLAFTDEIGSFPVTEQLDITVSSDTVIPPDIKFSCTDNSALLGTKEETDTEFRRRILTDTSRQDTLSELVAKLKNLPYLFDVTVKFNDSLSNIVYDGVIIPPYCMAVFYSGSPRNEIAEVVASYGIYPTVQTEDSVSVYYSNNVFEEGRYTVHIIPFKKLEFKARVNYKIDLVYADTRTVESKIRQSLTVHFSGNVHQDYIKENELYDVIQNLSLVGVDLLNVDLLINDTAVDYISVPLSRIPLLTDVNFVQV